MSRKAVTITLTQEQQDKARKLSIKVLGRANISGFISYLINKEEKELK